MKNELKQLLYNGVSIVPAVIAGKNAYDSLDLTEKAMQEIVKQFQNSGADNVQYVGTNIDQFGYSFEDFNSELTALKNQMDFSAVPGLYTQAGDLGFKIALISELVGAGLGILGIAKKNSHINGLAKVGRRAGLAYGLGQVLSAKEGLENMPYTITNPSTQAVFSLAEYSDPALGMSSVYIEPLVEQGVKTLNTLFGVGLGVGIGVEAGLELAEYFRGRTPSNAVKQYNKEKIEY